MKKVIVTGFEPFGEYTFNPTQELASWNNMRTITGQEQIIGLVLPSTYYGAFKILEKVMIEEKPDVIISTGLSSSVKSIRFETRFHNKMESKYADADNYQPKGLRINVKENAQKFFETNADIKQLRKLLQSEKIETEISIDANTFICNSLAYLTIQKIVTQGLPTRFIFLHIPWTDDYTSQIELEPGKVFMSKNTLYNAIDLLVENI